MFRIFTLSATLLLTTFLPRLTNAQVKLSDSLALVDLYNKTNGAGWYKSTNWLTANPVSTWYGIKVVNNRVDSIGLGNNNLIGSLPASIGDLHLLRILNLSSNQLKKSIPSTLGNLEALTFLNFYNNGFTGSIPESIGNCSNLEYLSFEINHLSGPIPESLGNCTKLESINMYANQLTSIPASIGNLHELWYLNIVSNGLSGSIPASIGNCRKLQNLILYFNNLTGSLPPTLGKCTELKELALFVNQLSGEVPRTLGNCKKLERLYLNQNQFTGPVPVTLGNCTKMQIFDLSDNHLTGGVPASLANLPENCSIGLAGNELSGNIPVPIHRTGRKLYIYDNRFNFTPLEPAVPKYSGLAYFSQKNIPYHLDGNVLSVTAGGTLSNNTYKWYKNGVLVKTAVGDSTLALTGAGKYSANVTNKIATALTLHSDTLILTVMQTATRQTRTDVKNAMFTLSPNPASNYITIKGTEGEMKIYTADGRLVKQQYVNCPTAINIASLTPGIYYVEINKEGKISSQQFIRQ